MWFRWRMQFTVRTLLIVMAISAMTAWLGSTWLRAQRQSRIVEEVMADTYPNGEPCSTVTYDFERLGYTQPRLAPPWLVDAVGVDCFADVVGVTWKGQPLGEAHGVLGLALLSELTALEELSIPASRVADRDVVQLNRLTQLRHLDISFSNVTGVGLAQATYRDRLRSLSLRGCPVSDEGLAVIATFENLERLDLSAGAFPPAPFSHDGLAGLASLRRLRALCLAGVPIVDADLAEIAKLKSLEYLAISPSTVTGNGIMQLDTLTSLKRLDVEGREPKNIVLVYRR